MLQPALFLNHANNSGISKTLHYCQHWLIYLFNTMRLYPIHKRECVWNKELLMMTTSTAHDKMTSLIIRVMTVVTVASLSVIWRQHSVSVSLSHDLYPSLIIDLSEATHKLTFWFIFLWYNYLFYDPISYDLSRSVIMVQVIWWVSV